MDLENNRESQELPPKEKTEGSSKMEPTTKEPTPQELQQKIYSENLRDQLNNNRLKGIIDKPNKMQPELVSVRAEIEPSIAAIVASIESGAAFVILLDNGKEVTLHASKLSQPAILGLMVKFAHQLTTQEIIPKGANNG